MDKNGSPAPHDGYITDSPQTPSVSILEYGLRGAKALASLKLTVALFVLSLILIFVGTLAQVEHSNFAVVQTYFRSFLVWVPAQLLVYFGQTFFWLPKSLNLSYSFPFPGGLALGTLLLVNLVAAHLLRFKLSWKRSGILILHFGLILLLANEIVTYLWGVEGLMSIMNGQSSNFLEDPHEIEFAVIDPSDPKEDEVTVVPGPLLRGNSKITNPLLPFDLVVDQYMKNTRFQEVGKSKSPNPATRGLGLGVLAFSQKEVGGVSEVPDMVSAYVTLFKKGADTPLGTYLVSQLFSRMKQADSVTIDGKSYQISLRSRRTYKPFTITLKEFRHDRHMGTDNPSNFASTVQLVDPSNNEDREAKIWMNHPLRYRGETFYQQSFQPGDTGTVLQVVRNPGWMLPYLSCAIVTVGMLIHFGIHLLGFLKRKGLA